MPAQWKWLFHYCPENQGMPEARCQHQRKQFQLVSFYMNTRLRLTAMSPAFYFVLFCSFRLPPLVSWSLLLWVEIKTISEMKIFSLWLKITQSSAGEAIPQPLATKMPSLPGWAGLDMGTARNLSAGVSFRVAQKQTGSSQLTALPEWRQRTSCSRKPPRLLAQWLPGQWKLQ